MNSSDPKKRSVGQPDLAGYGEIRLQVPENLSTAWQRCSWVLLQEKGQSRLETMEEMIRDFLIKHGC